MPEGMGGADVAGAAAGLAGSAMGMYNKHRSFRRMRNQGRENRQMIGEQGRRNDIGVQENAVARGIQGGTPGRGAGGDTALSHMRARAMEPYNRAQLQSWQGQKEAGRNYRAGAFQDVMGMISGAAGAAGGLPTGGMSLPEGAMAPQASGEFFGQPGMGGPMGMDPQMLQLMYPQAFPSGGMR